MGLVQWRQSGRSSGPTWTLFTTGEIGTLGNTSGVLSSAISNDSTSDELDLYMDAELVVTFAAAPTTDSLVELYVVRTVDGTNFEDSSTEQRPKLGFVGGWVVNDSTVAQRLVIPQVRLPPEDFRLYAFNNTGQAFSTNGTNVVRGLFYTENVST